MSTEPTAQEPVRQKNTKLIKFGWLLVLLIPIELFANVLIVWFLGSKSLAGIKSVLDVSVFIIGVIGVLGLPIGVGLIVLGYNYRPNRPNKNVDFPPAARGWNWGAFLLGPIWGIANGVWVSLFQFIPYLGWFIMPIIMGVKGSEWAWRNKQWSSTDEFKIDQRRWIKWGIMVTLGYLILGILVGALRVLSQ